MVADQASLTGRTELWLMESHPVISFLLHQKQFGDNTDA